MTSCQDFLSFIVPTLGRSPWLRDCLLRLREDAAEGGASTEGRSRRRAHIVLVCQGMTPSAEVRELADVVLCLARPCGFATANNLALAHCRGPWVALVNDDVLLDAGWCDAVLRCLRERPAAAAVQGVQRRMDAEQTLDGWGIGWNRYWQAVQLGHGEPVERAPTAARQIFGASATAAVYRRAALQEVALADGGMFDARLFAYYEDVHLAIRLRAAGFEAWMTPDATARHGGSTSGHQLAYGGLQWIYGNRQLVLLDLLGRRYWRHWPMITGRDVVDGLGYLKKRSWRGFAAVLVGHWRALRRLPGFVRWGAPRIEELEAFRVDV